MCLSPWGPVRVGQASHASHLHALPPIVSGTEYLTYALHPLRGRVQGDSPRALRRSARARRCTGPRGPLFADRRPGRWTSPAAGRRLRARSQFLQCLGAIVNQLPGAIQLGADLAMAVARAAARAVQLALGAAGDRANADELAQAAVAAAGALLRPHALRFEDADELRVQPG